MASKRRIRRKQCEGKRRYSDKKECADSMSRVNRQNESWERLNVYKCRFCKGCHFGHMPGDVIAQIDKRK